MMKGVGDTKMQGIMNRMTNTATRTKGKPQVLENAQRDA